MWSKFQNKNQVFIEKFPIISVRDCVLKDKIKKFEEKKNNMFHFKIENFEIIILSFIIVLIVFSYIMEGNSNLKNISSNQY